MANQQKWRPLERSEIHGPLEIQMGGKGDFHHMHAELAAGTLSLHRVARTGPLVATFRVPPGEALGLRNPKSARADRPHCFRLDLPAPDSAGVSKYICDPESAENRYRWERALAGRVSAAGPVDIDTMAGARYKVLKRPHVRKAVEEDSDRLGARLKPGMVIDCIERAICPMSGIPRVQFAQGWVSEVERSGERVLELLDAERWQRGHWRPSEDVTHCSDCYVGFSLLVRRHHCRRCGDVFCDGCSSELAPLPQLCFDAPQRVCRRCADALRKAARSDVRDGDDVAAAMASATSGGPSFLAKMDAEKKADLLALVADSIRFDQAAAVQPELVSRYNLGKSQAKELVAWVQTTHRPQVDELFRGSSGLSGVGVSRPAPAASPARATGITGEGAPLAPIQDDVSDSDLAEAVGSAETLQVLMAVRLMQRGVPALAYVGIKADLEARFGQPAFERAKAHVQVLLHDGEAMRWEVVRPTPVQRSLPSEKQWAEPDKIGELHPGEEIHLLALLPPFAAIAPSGAVVEFIAHCVNPKAMVGALPDSLSAEDAGWAVGWSPVSDSDGPLLRRVKTTEERRTEEETVATERAEAQAAKDAKLAAKEKKRAEKTAKAAKKLAKFDTQLGSLKQALGAAVAREEYGQAKEIQTEMAEVQSHREAFEAKFLAWQSKQERSEEREKAWAEGSRARAEEDKARAEAKKAKRKQERAEEIAKAKAAEMLRCHPPTLPSAKLLEC